MEHWLENVCEPNVLILAWKAPDLSSADRFRWAVGTVSRHESGAILRYIPPGAAFSEMNDGRTYEELIAANYAGYPAFNPKHLEHHNGVMEALMRRLPPRNRQDFEEYRRHFRISTNLAFSDFGLLALTQATLPNDGFSLVDPLDGTKSSCDLLLEVAGFRHYHSSLDHPIEVGDAVEIAREPDNQHDRNAVAFFRDGQKFGYVNRLQTTAFADWLLERDIDACVERINGRRSQPRVFVFIRIRPRLTLAA